MSSPRPLGPLCLSCTPHSTLNRVRIYMTSQSLQCSSYLSWAVSPLQKQDIWRTPSPLSPHPLPKLSLRTTEDNLFIPGLWCWEHRQMAPELAAQQTQKVPNTISSKQPELSPLPTKCGEQCSKPFPGSLQPEAQREFPRAQRSQEEEKNDRVINCHCRGAEMAVDHLCEDGYSLSPYIVQGWCWGWLPSLGWHFPPPKHPSGAGGSFILASDVWGRDDVDPSGLSWLITW